MVLHQLAFHDDARLMEGQGQCCQRSLRMTVACNICSVTVFRLVLSVNMP